MKRLLPLLILTACATPPEKIAAVDISSAPYQAMECAALKAERDMAATKLGVLFKQQKNAVTGDAVGVFLVGIPVSSATGGDKETVIAVEKGRLAAMDRAITGRC